MGCESCGAGVGGTPKGCGNKGNCGSGGCNKRNTYDWLSLDDIYDPTDKQIVEVSFKKGARKNFYKLRYPQQCITGDVVAVESRGGYDIGTVTLSGALVPLQMKKKKVKDESIQYEILRVANTRDLERLHEVREREQEALVKTRSIARMLMLDMKIGDIEYQGDGRKVTVYYTAEGRVDFRELVREYARALKSKVEMRQIGARQESQRIGGLGTCGRELCCSTWLSSFKTVSTAAARYQNLSINQTKLSGQCGRLKCCLNYELDTYMDALKDFPKNANTLHTQRGKAILIKMDIFKGIMHYAYQENGRIGAVIPLPIARVHDIQALNKSGKKPEDLVSVDDIIEESKEIEWADVTGEIEVDIDLRRKKKSRGKNRKSRNRNRPKSADASKKPQGSRQDKKQDGSTPAKKSGGKKRRYPRKKNNNSNKPSSDNTK